MNMWSLANLSSTTLLQVAHPQKSASKSGKQVYTLAIKQNKTMRIQEYVKNGKWERAVEHRNMPHNISLVNILPVDYLLVFNNQTSQNTSHLTILF
jgi:hypothetical protein